MSKSAIKIPEHYTKDYEDISGYKPEVLKGILGFMNPYKKQLIISFVLMVIGSVAAVAGPYYTKIALDDGIVGQNREILGTALLFYLGTVVVQWGVTFTRINIMARVVTSSSDGPTPTA